MADKYLRLNNGIPRELSTGMSFSDDPPAPVARLFNGAYARLSSFVIAG